MGGREGKYRREGGKVREGGRESIGGRGRECIKEEVST